MKAELMLYQALISIKVPEHKAHAVVEALESDMQTALATKVDISTLRSELHADMAQLELKLTLRMGVMLTAAVGVLIAVMKVLL